MCGVVSGGVVASLLHRPALNDEAYGLEERRNGAGRKPVANAAQRRVATGANMARSRVATGAVTGGEAHAIGFQRGTLAAWN